MKKVDFIARGSAVNYIFARTKGLGSIIEKMHGNVETTC